MLAEAETELGKLLVLRVSRSGGVGGNGGTNKGREEVGWKEGYRRKKEEGRVCLPHS